MPPSRLLINLVFLLFGLILPLLALGNQDFLQLQQEIRSERPVRQLAISADEAILALGMQDGDDTVVEFRDRRSGRILGTLRSASNELTTSAFIRLGGNCSWVGISDSNSGKSMICPVVMQNCPLCNNASGREPFSNR